MRDAVAPIPSASRRRNSGWDPGKQRNTPSLRADLPLVTLPHFVKWPWAKFEHAKIQTRTDKQHPKTSLTKLGVHDKQQLVHGAVQAGVADLAGGGPACRQVTKQARRGGHCSRELKLAGVVPQLAKDVICP